jgi:uncharacterized cupin superfamily protein
MAAIAKMNIHSTDGYVKLDIGGEPLGELLHMRGEMGRGAVCMWKLDTMKFHYTTRGDNLLLMVEGHSRIRVVEDGWTLEVGPGDAFVIPEGVLIDWWVLEPITVYCVMITDPSKLDDLMVGNVGQQWAPVTEPL